MTKRWHCAFLSKTQRGPPLRALWFDLCILFECSGHMLDDLSSADRIRTKAGLTVIAPTRGRYYKGSDAMNIDIKTYVVGLLESYQKSEKQIELLHYELSHPISISENEMIGALALAHGDGGSHPDGHISDKTLYIAMNYRQRAEAANKGTKTEIVTQLVELESKQERLKYYVSLLDARKAELLGLLYFEGYPQEECAKKLGITTRTVRRIKDEAIRELTELYCFTEGITSKNCPEAVQHVSQ